MGKYERRTRPGWMLYHENLPMLEALPPEDVKALIVALTRYSIALANDEPPPDFSSVASPMGQAMCQAFSARIARDDRGYKETCSRRSQRSTKDDLSQLKLTKADLRQVTKSNDKQTITQQKYNSIVTEDNTSFSEGGAGGGKKAVAKGLRKEAEERAKNKLHGGNPSEAEIQEALEEVKHAKERAKDYGMPNSRATRSALLEDVDRIGWEAVEKGLNDAAVSNSRDKLSVNYYRLVLQNGTKRRNPASHCREL